MTVSLKHNFVSAIPDDPASVLAGEVVPTNWNAEHNLLQSTNTLLGRSSVGTGPTEEIAVGAGLSLAAGTLSATGGGGGPFLPLLFSTDNTVTTAGFQMAFQSAGSARPVQMHAAFPNVAPWNNVPGLLVGTESGGNFGISVAKVGTGAATFRWYKANGTMALPTDVVATNVLGGLIGFGYSAGAFNFCGGYQQEVASAPVGSVIPLNHVFYVGFAANSDRFTIALDNVTSRPPITVVPTTAAGTVAQVLVDSSASASFCALYDNGTAVIDSDVGTGTNILLLKYNGTTKAQFTYQGLLALPDTASQFTIGTDTGLKRQASGVMEINNGVAGSLRDLNLRNVIATGAVSSGGGYTTGVAAPSGYLFATAGMTLGVNAGDNLAMLATSSSYGVVGMAGVTLYGAGTTKDTGLYRNAAGVVEVNNGTAGTLRDITARMFIAPQGSANGVQIGAAGGNEAHLFQSFNQTLYMGFSGTTTGIGFDNTGVYVRSNGMFRFSTSTTDPLASQTALGQNAAGVLEINNGTAAAYRDLKLRNFELTNPRTIGGIAFSGTANIEPSVSPVAVTTGRALALTDMNKIIQQTDAGAQTLSIPLQSSVTWVGPNTILILPYGAGVLTLDADTGVTLNGVNGGAVALDKYQTAVLRWISADLWVVSGTSAAVA